MTIDQIAYFLKRHLNPIYRMAERAVGIFVFLSNKGAIASALEQSEIVGHVAGKPAKIRPLTPEDSLVAQRFFAEIPEEHFGFFKPHGFSLKELRAVFGRPDYLTYGIFIEDALVGYGILKLFLGQKTFRGRLVSPECSGMGVGRFLSKYLSWQVSLLGFRARSTISRKNIKSLKTHEIEGGFDVIAELPNDYMLIEFHSQDKRAAPELEI